MLATVRVSASIPVSRFLGASQHRAGRGARSAGLYGFQPRRRQPQRRAGRRADVLPASTWGSICGIAPSRTLAARPRREPAPPCAHVRSDLIAAGLQAPRHGDGASTRASTACLIRATPVRRPDLRLLWVRGSCPPCVLAAGGAFISVHERLDLTTVAGLRIMRILSAALLGDWRGSRVYKCPAQERGSTDPGCFPLVGPPPLDFNRL